MNEIAKQAAAARLRKGMELEKLSTKETAVCLGLNPIYISMFLNEKSWPKCPAYAFDRLLDWCNHGSTLRSFIVPEGMSVWKPAGKEPKQEPTIKVKPEALEKRKKELANKENNVDAGRTATDEPVTPPAPEFREISTTDQHIEIKPGEEVEFRRTLKDEHQDSPVKTGEYIDLIEAIKLVAEKLPENVSIEITINRKNNE